MADHASDRAKEVSRRGTADRRRRRTTVGVMLLAAALVRLLSVWQTGDVPFVRQLSGDAAGYVAWAHRIADGAWLGDESFYQAPLYPYTLAVIFKLFGSSVVAVRVVQALWGAAAVWAMCFAAGRVFGRRCGLIAGWMLALYGPAVFFDGIIQKASLGGLLLCVLLAAMAWAADRASMRAVGVIGAAAGLLALTRENALIWLPVLAVWIAFLEGDAWSRRIARVVVFGIGVAAFLVPVGAFNRSRSGAWSITTFQAGPNFYIGNHRGASGRYQPLVRGHETPAFERRDATRLAERAVGRSLTPRAVSRYWFERATADIREAPGAWLGLMGRKFAMVVNRYEISDFESPVVYASVSPVLAVVTTVWHFGVLCPLAMVGVVATRSRWRRLWVYYVMIVTMAAAVALFFVLARYRYPLAPLLIPFAAVGAAALWDGVRLRDWKPLAGLVAVAVVVAVAVNVPVQNERRLNGMAWMNVGVAVAREGDLALAGTYFRRAVADNPGSLEAHFNLGQCLALQHDFAGAIPHYEAALRRDPNLFGVHFNLGLALEQVGRLDEALEHFERAVELNPNDADARAAVARLRR